MLAGIGYKIASTLAFACMMAIVKAYNQYPVGQLVFFRSFFALFVLAIWLSWRHEFPHALRTKRFGGHLFRALAGTGNMVLMFGAYSFLPLADVTAVGYAGPLIIIVLASVWLGERVGPARWLGVIIGFSGVILMLSEHLGGGLKNGVSGAAIGAMMALMGAFSLAVAMIQTRRLVQTEHMGAVVFYFQFTASWIGIGLMLVGALWPSSWPGAASVQAMAWVWPEPAHWLPLICAGLLGGVGQILMTRGFTLADASVIACFDYTSMIWVLLLGILFLGEFPSSTVLMGASIVTAAGIMVIVSERKSRLR